MNSNKIMPRNQADPEYTWRLEDIYPTDDAWYADFEKAKSYTDKILSYKGKLSESGTLLCEYLKLNDEISVILDSLINYAHRKSDEDTTDSKYQNMSGQLTQLLVELNKAGSFETPELLSIKDTTLESFYKSCSDLELYRIYIDDTRRRRAHILSDAEEQILALSGDVTASPDNIFSMFNDADLKFPDAVDSEGNPVQITHGSYIPSLQSTDRVLRKSAFESLYSRYGEYKNTTAAILGAQVKQLIFRARARKYPSTLDASLDSTNVPTEVYTNLIDAVHSNMEYMYKYVRLRKKLLGVDELHMYDLYTPVVKDTDMKFTFEEAKNIVREALKPMGEEYIAILDEGFNNHWIDVYENIGKCSGAYSAGARVHPYVLLNFKGTLDSVFTLAHEMGHAIHSYLSNKTQPVVYSDYVIFVAEVASTCNEALLMEYMLSVTTDKNERAYLINYFLEQFRGTLYRQTMFAEFELMINRHCENGETLTADYLCDTYYKLNELYFGKDITIDKQIALEWSRIPHFYYNFYVFQYATGYSAAIALSRKILSEGEQAVKKYIEFLSGGCSKTPIELLKGAGVDMSTTKPVTDALKLFDELIDELDSICS